MEGVIGPVLVARSRRETLKFALRRPQTAETVARCVPWQTATVTVILCYVVHSKRQWACLVEGFVASSGLIVDCFRVLGQWTRLKGRAIYSEYPGSKVSPAQIEYTTKILEVPANLELLAWARPRETAYGLVWGFGILVKRKYKQNLEKGLWLVTDRWIW